MLFHLEINFKWSEKEIYDMPAHILKKRFKQLMDYKKDLNKKGENCPLLSGL
jgi:hypothetical protein